MNLTYVENYLINILDGSSEYIQIKLRELIDTIKDYREKEGEVEHVNTVLKIVDTYALRYLMLAEDFPTIDERNLIKRADKVQEILCVLGILETYLMGVTNRETVGDLHRVMRQLHTKREHYNKEKIIWMSTLKNINIRTEDIIVSKKIELSKEKT